MLAYALFVAACITPGFQDSEPRARCIWEIGGAEAELDGLRSCSTNERSFLKAHNAFERHAFLHGWSSNPDLPDLIDVSRAVPCPAAVVDLLASLAMPCNRDSANGLQRDAATVLERNGRVDEAAAVLGASFDRLVSHGGRWQRRPWLREEVSRVAEAAARLSARRERWDRALFYCEQWHSTSFCGNCAGWEEGRIEVFRARCLVRLQRWDDARSLCLANLNNGWRQDLDIVESWIDAGLLSGDCDTPEESLEQLRAFLTLRHAFDSENILEWWRITRLPRNEQLEHISLIAAWDRDDALRLLVPFSENGLERYFGAFDVVEGHLRDDDLASVLARTGARSVGAAIRRIDRASLVRPEGLSPLVEEWQLMRQQLDALAVP